MINEYMLLDMLNDTKAFLNAGRTKEASATLNATIAELQDEINKYEAKKAGGATVYKILKKLLTSAGKDRPILGKAKRDGDKLIFCNGYLAFSLKANEVLEKLPIHTKEDAERYPKTVADIVRNAAENTEEIKLPTLAEIKNFISEQKAKSKMSGATLGMVRYQLADTGVFVDAKVLADVLEVLKCDTAKITGQTFRRPGAPVYFQSQAGEAILCPVRPE